MNKVIQLLKKVYTSFVIHTKPENQLELELLQEMKNNVLEEKVVEDTILNSIAVKKFKNLTKGDLLFAKRVSKGNSKSIIKEGHEVGPFLVLENKQDKLLCAYGSSNCTRKEKQNRLIIDSQYYKGLTKKTCFYITDLFEITLETFIQKIGTLNEYEQHILQKKMNILARKNASIKKYAKDIDLELGDIFKFNKEFYLVYKIEEKTLTAIKVSTTVPCNFEIDGNNNHYYVHFNDVIETNKKQNFITYDFVLKEEFNTLLTKVKEYWIEEKKKNSLQRGSMVYYNGNFIYIYSQESEIYFGYKLYALSSNEEFPIVIQQQQYSADFGDVYEIQNKDTFKIIAVASEEEADKNKMTKKLYNRMHPIAQNKKTKKLKKRNIKEGVVVTDRTLMHAEYIVLQRKGHELLTVFLENNKFYFRYLDARQVDFNRKLPSEEFREILIQLKEKQSIYTGYIEEQKLSLLIDKTVYKE